MKSNLDKIEPIKSRHGGLRSGSGRPKGSPNKVSKSMKDNLITAFNEIGGVDRMMEWANKNDNNLGDFYRLCARLIPADLKEQPQPKDVNVIITTVKPVPENKNDRYIEN